MADQVWPLLIQVIAWLDLRLVQHMWSSYLASPITFLHCASCLSFKYVLRITLQLIRRVSNETAETEGNDGSAPVDEPFPRRFSSMTGDLNQVMRLQISSIIQSVVAMFPMVVPQIYRLALNTTSDRLVSLATEIMVIICACFSQKIPQGEHEQYCYFIINRLHQVRMLALSMDNGEKTADDQDDGHGNSNTGSSTVSRLVGKRDSIDSVCSQLGEAIERQLIQKSGQEVELWVHANSCIHTKINVLHSVFSHCIQEP